MNADGLAGRVAGLRACSGGNISWGRDKATSRTPPGLIFTGLPTQLRSVVLDAPCLDSQGGEQVTLCELAAAATLTSLFPLVHCEARLFVGP